MNKRPNSIIFSHKTGALCWEADANNTKLRNLFLIFKTPEIGSGAFDENVAKSRRIDLSIKVEGRFYEHIFRFLNY